MQLDLDWEERAALETAIKSQLKVCDDSSHVLAEYATTLRGVLAKLRQAQPSPPAAG